METIGKDVTSILRPYRALNDDASQQESSQMASAFRGFLQKREKWLLVFDNADNIEIAYDTYMPPNASGRVLFTSRNSRLARLVQNAEEIKVEGLPDNEALDMFLAIVNRADISGEHLENQPVSAHIVRELDNFPLAIAQAASFLRYYNSISGAEYIKYLKNEAERPTLLAFSTNYENYNKTVMTTWELSYRNLIQDSRAGNAAKILCLLGFLDPAGTSEKYLHAAHESRDGALRAEVLKDADFLKDNLNFKLSVDTLIALSLCQKSKNHSGDHILTLHPSGDHILTLHPLVHEWTRIRLRRDEPGKRLQNEMVVLSNALAIHHVDVSKVWEHRNLEERGRIWLPPPRNQLDSAIVRTGQAMDDMLSPSIETVLLVCADILYAQRTPLSRREELFPADAEYLARSQDLVGDTGSLENLSTVLGRPLGILRAIVRETWYPCWADLTESWLIVENLQMCITNHALTAYANCLLSGLRCLRALAKETKKLRSRSSDPLLRFAEPASVALLNSVAVQEKLNRALKGIVKGKRSIPALFEQWNISHDALPPTSEGDHTFSWYTHFRHSHVILSAKINGLLWPQYLRSHLYPSIDCELPVALLDTYYALEEPVALKAWVWEANCQAITPCTVEAQAAILLPTRFARLHKAGRFVESEQLCLSFLDRYCSSKPKTTISKQVALSEVAVVAESMLYRGAFDEAKQVLISRARGLFSKTVWDVQFPICWLSISILKSRGRDGLEDAEDLLILFIVAIFPQPKNSVYGWTSPVGFLQEINPASYSALALGQIYAQCELYSEAATLLSWGLDFYEPDPDKHCVRCLLKCTHKLELIDRQTFNALNEELDRPSQYANRENDYTYRGAWAVAKNDEFVDCRRKIRALEEQKQGVKGRFYDCLRRNRVDNEDFHKVDAVWDTMRMTKHVQNYTEDAELYLGYP